MIMILSPPCWNQNLPSWMRICLPRRSRRKPSRPPARNALSSTQNNPQARRRRTPRWTLKGTCVPITPKPTTKQKGIPRFDSAEMKLLTIHERTSVQESWGLSCFIEMMATREDKRVYKKKQNHNQQTRVGLFSWVFCLGKEKFSTTLQTLGIICVGMRFVYYVKSCVTHQLLSFAYWVSVLGLAFGDDNGDQNQK